MAEMESIVFEIKGNADSAAKSLTRFSSALRKVNNASGSASKLQKLSDSLQRLTDALGNVNSSGLESLSSALNSMTEHEGAISNVVGYMSALSQMDFGNLTTVADTMERIAQNSVALGNLQNRGGNNTQPSNGNEAQPRWSDRLIDLIQNTRLASEESGRFLQALDQLRIGIATGFVSGLDVAANAILRFVNLMRSVGSAVGGTLLQGLRSTGNAALTFARNLMQAPFRAAANGAKNLASKLDSVASSFKRIMFYRAIRAVIKEIGQALKEGTENAYWFSKNIGESTRYISEAYDQLNSASYTMGNQMGAAWATLYATIAPIVSKIVALVTQAIAVITQFFAILGGRGTYMKAINYTKDWADATAGGAGAAKEWKNQLMGFDEINRLEDQNGGGGGGGGGAPDYANMFEEAMVDSKIADLAAQIKQAVESGDWDGLGKLIGDKINKVFDPERFDWKGLGTKIGVKIQAVIGTAYSFLKTVDFQQIGADIADSVNGVLSRVNFETAGRLIVRRMTAMWDFVLGAVQRLNFGELAKSISDYIVGAFNELAEWISQLDAASIVTAITTFFENVKWQEISDSFFGLLAAALSKIDDVLDEINWDISLGDIGRKIIEVIGNSIEKTDFAQIHNILQYKIDKAVFGEKVANWWWSKGEYAGKDIILGMINGIEEPEGELATSAERAANAVVDTFNEHEVEFSVQVQDDSSIWWDNVRNWWDAKKGDVEEFTTKVKDDSSEWWSNVASWWGDKKTDTLEFAVKVKNDAASWWSNVQSWWNSIASDLWTTLNIKIPSISAEWVPFTSLFGQTLSYPKFSIAWNAKGGIVDDATLIGAGEAGKEAIIPLERNTEWISKVASELNEQQRKQTSVSGGHSDDGEIINAIFAAASQIVGAIAENSGASDIDWRHVSAQVTKYQRQIARVSG